MQSKLIYVPSRFALAVIFISLILALCLPAMAQGPGSLDAPSLLFSPSAVANGMGSGLVAGSTEASAIHYNPAALSRLGRIAVEGNTWKLFPLLDKNARYRNIAGSFRISSTRKLWLGAGYAHTGYGEQIITGEDSPKFEKFEPHEWLLSLALATELNHHTRLGVGFKFVRVNHGPSFTGSKDISASAFAVDLGFLYDGFLPVAHLSKQFLSHPLPWRKWTHQGLSPGFSLGVTLLNVGTKLKFIEGTPGSSLPQSLRTGLSWNVFESDLIGLVAIGEFAKSLVKINKTGGTDGGLKAIFTAWGDQSLRDEFSEVIYAGGLEVNLMQFAAIRFGRYWDGTAEFGDNTFGYSIGPPGFRFSFAKYTPFRSLFIEEWRVYTVSIVLDKLPF